MYHSPIIKYITFSGKRWPNIGKLKTPMDTPGHRWAVCLRAFNRWNTYAIFSNVSRMLHYLWKIQTSAINCSLLLNVDRPEKSLDSWIFLAASAISFNSLFIALCQCNISSTGRFIMNSVWKKSDSEKSILPLLEDLQALFSLSIGQNDAPTSECGCLWYSEWSSRLLRFFLIFFLSIQLKMILIIEKSKSVTSYETENYIISHSHLKWSHLLKKLLFRDYSPEPITHVQVLIRWYRGWKPRKKLCHHIYRNAA